MDFITLDANRAKVAAYHAARAARDAMSLEDRAAKRKEIAASDGDFTRLMQMDRQAIDLAIHLDSFLDDASIMSDATSGEAIYWRSTYDPVVGVYMGSVYGGPASTLYQRQDFFQVLQPFTVDTEAVQVPNIGLTLDPSKLRLRDSALKRQAEALKLKGEQFLMATILGANLGTDIATALVAYVTAAAAYTGKTVYIVDPLVQTGTFETSNILSLPSEGGLTPFLAESLTALLELMGREARTVHIPVAGQPWRKLLRNATLSAITNQYNVPGTALQANPISPNAGLRAIAPAQLEQVMNTRLQHGVNLNWFGMNLKFKSNNVLPQGYGFVTTDQPCAEIFNITDASVSVDYIADQQNPYFSNHYEKRSWVIGAPDPWRRNFVAIQFGATAGL